MWAMLSIYNSFFYDSPYHLEAGKGCEFWLYLSLDAYEIAGWQFEQRAIYLHEHGILCSIDEYDWIWDDLKSLNDILCGNRMI